MKVYISVDIEGSAGITHWNEARKDSPEYTEFRERMTGEAVAACEGAIAAGATEIWVKDAHGTGRNIFAEQLPKEARLIRGWSGHPYGMLQELDDTFDAVALVGWHGPASHPNNPLSHTLRGIFARMTLNDVLCSEYLLHAHVAALTNTPIVLLSGDVGICEMAMATNSAIHTVETNTGHGASVIGIQPELARSKIRDNIELALRSELSEHVQPRSDHYKFELRFNHHSLAYQHSFYPGVSQIDSETLLFEHKDYFEIARFLCFVK